MEWKSRIVFVFGPRIHELFCSRSGALLGAVLRHRGRWKAEMEDDLELGAVCCGAFNTLDNAKAGLEAWVKSRAANPAPMVTQKGATDGES